jgi:hypothetical protein
MSASILDTVRSAYAAGLCLLPVKEDGSKMPDLPEWTPFKSARPAIAQMRKWDFAARTGFGMVAGAVSGYCGTFDFDCGDTFQRYVELGAVTGLGDVIARIRAGYEDSTPGGGRRWIVRYPPTVTWSLGKLASRQKRSEEVKDKHDKVKTLIETTLFAVLAPSNGTVHPSGRSYEHVSGGFDTIASVTEEELHALLDLARSFDQMPVQNVAPKMETVTIDGLRPGDDFNQRAAWPDILPDWVEVCRKGDVIYLCRPGKERGISATLNFTGRDRLHVFTSSTPFEQGRSYDKFAAHVVLNHGGDFRKAARALAQEGYGRAQSQPAPAPTVEPYTGPAIDLARLLSALTVFIRRFVVLTPEQLTLVALWVTHTHAFDAADCTPYLAVNSAEMGSGKTRLLEVLQLLVNKPWFTGRCTAAVLVRKIAAETPTLLLDESDAAFNGPDDYAEALRGLLNAGHRRGGCHSLCVGQGANLSYKDFPVYSPKAIAGLGQLPPTVRDRAVTIVLKKRTRQEHLERFRRKLVEPEAMALSTQLAQWATTPAVVAALRGAVPALPEAISDRAQECLEPLLAIADLAGGDWPIRARAAVELVVGTPEDNPTIGVTLLRDIFGVFAETGRDAIASADLVKALVELESRPWATCSTGQRPLTTHGLASRLKPFRMAPTKVWIDGKSKNGYTRRMFEDEWSRHCPDLLAVNEDAVEPAYAPDPDFRVEGRKDTNKNRPELPIFRVEGESGPSTLKSAIPSMNTGLPSDLPVENPDHQGSHDTTSMKVERPEGENGHVPELEKGDL